MDKRTRRSTRLNVRVTKDSSTAMIGNVNPDDVPVGSASPTFTLHMSGFTKLTDQKVKLLWDGVYSGSEAQNYKLCLPLFVNNSAYESFFFVQVYEGLTVDTVFAVASRLFDTEEDLNKAAERKIVAAAATLAINRDQLTTATYRSEMTWAQNPHVVGAMHRETVVSAIVKAEALVKKCTGRERAKKLMDCFVELGKAIVNLEGGLPEDSRLSLFFGQFAPPDGYNSYGRVDWIYYAQKLIFLFGIATPQDAGCFSTAGRQEEAVYLLKLFNLLQLSSIAVFHEAFRRNPGLYEPILVVGDNPNTEVLDHQGIPNASVRFFTDILAPDFTPVRSRHARIVRTLVGTRVKLICDIIFSFPSPYAVNDKKN